MDNISLIIKEVSVKITEFIKPLLPTIDSITDGHREFFIHTKDQEPSGVKFLSPGELGIYWSVDDFEHKAKEQFTLWQERGEHRKNDVWEDVYDKSKFYHALQLMINGQDADIGISWNTIEYYLNEHCLKTK